MNENINKPDYKVITPFKGWVIENFPFIEADFDAISNYQLISKVVEYLNQVISNENLTEQKMGELVTAYNNLKNYIDNYFSNLDLQEEINIKLDKMAVDGTLTNVIKNYVDPIQQSFENEINNNIENQNEEITNFKSYVNGTLNQMQSEINSVSSGSPAGVYATVSDLESDNPDHTKIYLVSADGKWYYYNTSTSQWTAGGDYLATSESDMIENQIENNKHFIYDYIPDLHLGKSITTSNNGAVGGTVGNYSTSTQYDSIKITCSEGDKFYISGYGNGTSQRLYVFYDSDGLCLERNDKYNDIINTIITAPENAVGVACNFDKSYSRVLYRYTKEIENIATNTNNITSNTNKINDQIINNENFIYNYTKDYQLGRSISSGTTVSDHSSSSAIYNCIDLEVQAGDKFKVSGYSYASSQRLYVFYDSERNVLEQNTRVQDVVELIITAPTNAVGLVSNIDTTYGGYLLRCTPELEKVERAYEYFNNGLKNDTSTEKYIIPKYNQVYPLTTKQHTYSMDHSYSFSQYYTLYHNLYTSYSNLGLEEINMSTDYLAHNVDSIPSYITNITDGGLYMYHLPPREGDGHTGGTHSKKIKILITSGIHGSEKKSIWNTYYLLKDLLENNSNLNYGLSIIRNYCDLYIMPLCNPYGIENDIRNNGNNVNLNRDFYIPNWSQTSDSGNTYESQYETRCISWWVDELEPDTLIDHHTSSGDENRMTQWGNSCIEDILSLIDEQNIIMTQENKNNFPTKFANYNNVFGHSVDSSNSHYGMLSNSAYYKGIISCTFEIVQHVKWDGVYIFATNEADETSIMSIDYQAFINYLIAYLNRSVEYLNSNLLI